MPHNPTGKYSAGPLLRAIRLNHPDRWTAKELAEFTGFSESFISDVERGHRMLTYPLFSAARNALDMSETHTAGLVRRIKSDLYDRWQTADRNR